MAKDPAFLFYSKEFYEGTRTMLPEERACYIDLLIYQHQHGEIPLDLRRVLMYCSGILEATLQATLQAKFEKTETGYYNIKLRDVIADRSEYAGKQSDNGIVGQFFKKAKKATNDLNFTKLREYIYQVYGKEKLLNDLKNSEATHEATLEALLEASLKHLSITNSISISNELNKGVPKKIKETPTLPQAQPEIRTRLDLTASKLIEMSNTGEPRAKIESALFDAMQRNPNTPQDDVCKSYAKYSAYLLKTGYSRKALTAWLNEDKFLNDWLKEAHNSNDRNGKVEQSVAQTTNNFRPT